MVPGLKVVAAVLLAVGVAGCNEPLPENPKPVITPIPDAGARVIGLIEALPLAGSPAPTSAVVRSMSPSGLSPVEEADLDPDAQSYEVRSVTPNVPYTLVSVLNEASEPLGHVLIQDPLDRAEEPYTVQNEPIDAETTLEGQVLIGLIGNFDAPFWMLSPPVTVLVHRMPDDVAIGVLQDERDTQAVTEAYRRARDVFFHGLRNLGSTIRVTAILEAELRAAAQRYAETVDAGAPKDSAHRAFVDEAMEAYVQRIEDPYVLAIAWDAFAVVHDERLRATGLGEDLWLASATNLLAIATRSRTAVVRHAEAPEEARTAVLEALDAMAEVARRAGSMAELSAGIEAARQQGVAALEEALGRDVDERSADLERFVASSSGLQTVDVLLPDYVTHVAEAEPTAGTWRLLIALMAGPSYGE